MTTVLELVGISKDYRGLRPLRIADLRIAAAEHVAILGFDQPTAEVFVNLATDLLYSLLNPRLGGETA